MIFHPSSKMSRRSLCIWEFPGDSKTKLHTPSLRILAPWGCEILWPLSHGSFPNYIVTRSTQSTHQPLLHLLYGSCAPLRYTPSEECSKGAVSGTPWKRGSLFALQGVQCYSELGTPYACFLKVAKYFAERIQHCLNAIVYWKEIDDPGRNCDKTMCNISFEGVTKRGQYSGRTMTH